MDKRFVTLHFPIFSSSVSLYKLKFSDRGIANSFFFFRFYLVFCFVRVNEAFVVFILSSFSISLYFFFLFSFFQFVFLFFFAFRCFLKDTGCVA